VEQLAELVPLVHSQLVEMVAYKPKFHHQTDNAIAHLVIIELDMVQDVKLTD